MKIRKVFNNNVVLAVRDGEDRVLLGRGIGYGKGPGDIVDPDAVQQMFVPATGDSALGPYAAFLPDLDLEDLEFASEMGHRVARALGIQPTAAFVIPLADHLGTAAQRMRLQGDQGAQPHPLAMEVRQLYPREIGLAREIIQRYQRVCGRRLPAGEETAIALHLVNSQAGSPSIAAAMRMTETMHRALDIVDAILPEPLDRDSLAVARFVTHLRYLFARMRDPDARGAHPDLGSLAASLRAEHPEAHRAAQRIAYLIQAASRAPCGRNETMYLTIHVVRLAAGERGGG